MGFMGITIHILTVQWGDDNGDIVTNTSECELSELTGINIASLSLLGCV
jgi:hypothetical protein